MTVTRFAPSPTGHLHVGNIRTALLNWLLVRNTGGEFLLRLDDTDHARSREEYVQSIRADLEWLGLRPDREERQSARLPRYEAEFQKLVAQGRVYRAYETPEELELKRRLQLGRGEPPVYDRAALQLGAADHARLAAEGVAPHWRFRLDASLPHSWDDLVRGASHIDIESLSDPVIRRADGSWLYMLPSVIDDIDMAVSHVIRGEDHVTNTGIQLQMFASLGAAAPRFGHAPLLTGSDGALSKRLGSIGVAEFRARGIEAIAVKALLARLGTSLPVEPVGSDAELIAGFDIGNLGRATARFDEAELQRLNAHILHQLPYAAVRERVPLDAREWQAVRGNLEVLADAEAWRAILHEPLPTPAVAAADREFFATAATLLDGLEFGDSSWQALTDALKAATGRRGKALFAPLRLALTGALHGPDMGALLPLIGRTQALARLRAAAAG